MNLSDCTKLCNCRVDAVVDIKSAELATILNLFMSIVAGLDGHGNEDILILNCTFAVKDILVILNPILLFTTYAR